MSSQIDQAMLWQMQVTPPKRKSRASTLTRGLSEEIEAAMAHYETTRKQGATLCLVDPWHGPVPNSMNGCAVKADRSVVKFCLLVGMSKKGT